MKVSPPPTTDAKHLPSTLLTLLLPLLPVCSPAHMWRPALAAVTQS
jgi:hypothetical protein